MTLELAVAYRKQSRMEDQDRVSQTSSVSTVSFLQTRDKCHEKVQTFGKRCQAVKRDPNCPVVIRGWLYKRDSTGLKLWKRRWFVLSNYCLYYYKDSREESVLGSIPLPSYRILYCSPRECKNRKYTFKVVHQGMRPYILSAETQEDMLGWVRALSQSANMEADDIINRRCSSFQDFTQMRDETEMMELQQTPTFPERNTQTAGKLTRAQTEPTLQDQTMMGIKMKTPELRGRHEMRACDPESFQRSQSLEKADEEPFSFLNPKGTFGTAFPRDQYGSQYHGNTVRDGWLMENCSSAPLSPCIYTERRHMPDTSFPCAMCYSSNYHTAEHMTLCKTGKSDIVMEREIQAIRDLENDTDVVLTRLCGCDKLLQSLSLQLAQLQADKKNVEYALEMRWLEMEDVVPDEQEVSQKALLQEDLVTLRARICDVSLEMERAWSDYERMESELSVFYSHLQHILHFGMAQEQIQAQRQIWMMEDILCGLRVNKKRFMILLGLQAQTVPHPQTVSYFEEELGAHDMQDYVTQLQQQDFMKFHQNYTRNPQEIPGHDNRTTDAPQEPLRLTRVVSSTLPTSLIAERVFVEDPEQIPQRSGLKNSKTPKKPSRMLHEMSDKTRHCRWADLPEERLQKTLNQNPNEDDFKQQQQVQLEHKEATYLTDSESDHDLGITSQKWENKIRHVEREDRRLSADKEHFTDDIQRLGLITANEKETDNYKFTPDSSVLHLSNGYTADRRKIQSKNTETASPVTKAHTKSEDMTSRQSSCNDVIVIESHSINHISTLTVFKGHQGKNSMHKPQKKNRSSVSTNLKSECFLSNSRWSEVVPVYRQKPKPQASLLPLENQQIDQPSQNVENILTSVQSKLSPSGAHEGQNGADFQEGQSPKPPNQLQETQPNQPITTANNQSTCTSDQSRLDQCIYEEIQMIPPTLEDVKTHQNNHTAETPQSNATAEDESKSPNHKSDAREEYSTINMEGRRCPEVSKSRTGSDVACKRENGQETSVIKSSVINHHVQDCRPRITVVSTSL